MLAENTGVSRRSNHLAAVVAVGVIVGSVLLWQSRFSYNQMTKGDSTYPVRIDRLTGRADILQTSGWVPLCTTSSVAVGDDQIGLIDIDVSFQPAGEGEPSSPVALCDIYNRTNMTITELNVEIVTSSQNFSSSDSKIERNLRIPVRIGSHACETVPVNVGTSFADQARQNYPEWHILSAKGVPTTE